MTTHNLVPFLAAFLAVACADEVASDAQSVQAATAPQQEPPTPDPAPVAAQPAQSPDEEDYDPRKDVWLHGAYWTAGGPRHFVELSAPPDHVYVAELDGTSPQELIVTLGGDELTQVLVFQWDETSLRENRFTIPSGDVVGLALLQKGAHPELVAGRYFSYSFPTREPAPTTDAAPRVGSKDLTKEQRERARFESLEEGVLDLKGAALPGQRPPTGGPISLSEHKLDIPVSKTGSFGTFGAGRVPLLEDVTGDGVDDFVFFEDNEISVHIVQPHLNAGPAAAVLPPSFDWPEIPKNWELGLLQGNFAPEDPLVLYRGGASPELTRYREQVDKFYETKKKYEQRKQEAQRQATSSSLYLTTLVKGRFSERWERPDPSMHLNCCLADFNGDGAMDLFRHGGGGLGNIAIYYLSNRDGSFGKEAIANSRKGIAIDAGRLDEILVGNFNDDQMVDLYDPNFFASKPWWLSTAEGPLSIAAKHPGPFPPGPGRTSGLPRDNQRARYNEMERPMRDLTGEGLPDYFTIEEKGAKVSLTLHLLGEDKDTDGKYAFSDRVVPTGGRVKGAAFEDMNADGLLDLIVWNSDPPSFGYFINPGTAHPLAEPEEK